MRGLPPPFFRAGRAPAFPRGGGGGGCANPSWRWPRSTPPAQGPRALTRKEVMDMDLRGFLKWFFGIYEEDVKDVEDEEMLEKMFLYPLAAVVVAALIKMWIEIVPPKIVEILILLGWL